MENTVPLPTSSAGLKDLRFAGKGCCGEWEMVLDLRNGKKHSSYNSGAHGPEQVCVCSDVCQTLAVYPTVDRHLGGSSTCNETGWMVDEWEDM